MVALDEGPFLFVGDALALDLVNTEIAVRGKRRDLLATPGDVARWWQAARRHHSAETAVVDGMGSHEDEALRAALKSLRSALRRLFSALAEGTAPAEEDVGTLNAALKTGYHALEAAPDGTLRPVYRSTDAAHAAIVLPIAISALHLITQGDHRRLHKCGNERCVLLLYDRTKSATRRWCSVACKDRARKMKQYHAAKASA